MIYLPLRWIEEIVQSCRVWSGRSVRNDKLICIWKTLFTAVNTPYFMSAVIFTSGELHRKWNYNQYFMMFSFKNFIFSITFYSSRLCLFKFLFNDVFSTEIWNKNTWKIHLKISQNRYKVFLVLQTRKKLITKTI